MYKKRHDTNKIWPITRKGTKYVITPSHSFNNGIPLLIAMRDLLKIVKTRKELEKSLINKTILISGKTAKEDKRTLVLFDTIEIPDKAYRITYSERRKIDAEEIPKKEAKKKISKVINKTKLNGGKTQINFIDGINVISEEKIKIGDSALINLENGKIEKIIPIKEKSKILVIKGKHLGTKGQITNIEDKKINVKSDEKEFETKMGEIIAIE